MTQHDVFDQQTTFADLGLRDSVLKGLTEMGFVHPTHIQAQLIPHILAGRDVLGQAKTGTGKTAAFGLPILHLADKDIASQALILAPTRELAMQIVREINELGSGTPIRATGVVGGESMTRQRDSIAGGAQIVVGTPGRVMDMLGRGSLRFDNIRFVVLDEVDRMLDIGFREDIRKILGKISGVHQTIFVSATISEEIERLGRRYMKPDAQRIATIAKSLTVSQVTQHYVTVARRDKQRVLLELLTQEDPALTLVFCRMKVTVREVAQYLNDHKVEAYEIHADLAQGKRNRIMERLRAGKLEVLVASDLASRGLDVDGITHVINYDLPEDPEVYVHRIGRTARAGRSGTAWSFVEPDQGQMLTEVEKLTGVLIDRLDYNLSEKPVATHHTTQNIGPDFAHQPPAPGSNPGSAPKPAPEPDPIDPAAFPGGVIPKGPPPRTIGSRHRTRRSR